MSRAYSLSALTAGCLSVLVTTAAWSHDLGKANEAYVGDSGSHLVTDGFGNCVKTGFWSKDSDLGDCGAAPVEKAATPANPVASAAPVAAPVLPVAVSEAVSLSAGALFDVNSANLKDEGRAELSALAAQIQGMQEVRSIEVIGHTDSSGDAAYNQALSERRATAVKNFLLGQGIAPDVVSTVGKGESSPVASNATREGRARNRRVELTIEGTRIP